MTPFDSRTQDETITGTNGNDEYIFYADWGNHTINDTINDVEMVRLEVLLFKQATGLEDFIFSRASNGDVLITIAENQLTISAASYENASFVIKYGDQEDTLGFLYFSPEDGGDLEAENEENSILFGSDEDDEMEGDEGNDVFYGNDGDDEMEGDDGDDTFYGGAGEDEIEGDDGNDTIYGGGDNDVLEGGNGDDILHGGAGIDEIEGDDGNDTIYGGAANDELEGGDGNDTIYGDADNDELKGGDGNDILNGGAGNDTYVFFSDDGEDIIVDTEGQEELQFRNAGGLQDFSFLYEGDNLKISLGDDSVTISAESYQAQRFSLFYGYGNTLLGKLTIGTSGIDTLTGGDDADLLVAGAESDTLIGGAGDDTLIGGDGNDILDGGAGGDIINGGAGDDQISYEHSDEGVTILLTDNSASGGYAHNDVISNIENIRGSQHGDTLVGDSGKNEIQGLAGRDTIDGGEGDDKLIGGAGDDIYEFRSNHGHDIIVDNEGQEKLYFIKESVGPEDFSFLYEGNNLKISLGGDSVTVEDFDPSRFSIFYGVANDPLEGIILGTGGVDNLVSSIGDERIYGGGGDDSYEFGAGGARDTIIDLEGQESLYFKGITKPQDFSFQYEGEDLVILLGNDSGSVTIENGSYEALRFKLFYGRDDNALGNLAVGTSAVDTLYGGSSADWLVAGAGNDILDAADGDDRLDGGLGNDRLSGGGGEDTYIFRANDNDGGGFDRVVDDGGTIVLQQGESGADYASASYSYALSSGGKVLLTIHENGRELNRIEFSGPLDNYDFFTRIGTSDTAVNKDIFFRWGSEDSPFLATRQADSFVGPQGADWVSYENAASGISASLDNSRRYDDVGEYALGDSFTGISHLVGSAYGDHLRGDDSINILRGENGDDDIEGGGGSDILDGGEGMDVLSYRGSQSRVIVNLAYNFAIGGDASGDVISNFEGIEGSDFDDVLSGDNGVNVIKGGAGVDTIFGAGGNDDIDGGAGSDYIDGGAGTDTAYYISSTSGVTADLANRIDRISVGVDDVLISIENLQGSQHDDTLFGDAQVNEILGLAGDDVLDGGGGGDILDGGDGNDVLNGGGGGDILDGGDGDDLVSYEDSEDGVTVNLASNSVSGGDAQGDVIRNIEDIRGSQQVDTLIGDAGSNEIHGLAGDDTLVGGAGADVLNGGAGEDTASYADASDDGNGNGVTADLSGNSFNSGEAAGDTYSSIENLVGSVFKDVLTGDDDANELRGGDGNDELTGGVGDDILYGGAGIDSYYFVSSYGEDRIEGEADESHLYFRGEYSQGSFNFLRENGALRITTGQGSLALSNTYADGRYSIYYGDGDRFAGKLFVATDAGSTLSGTGDKDFLVGLDGADTLEGGAGSDSLIGGAGSDSYIFSAGDAGAVDVIEDDGGIIIFDQGASGADYAGASYSIVLNERAERLIVRDAQGEVLNTIEFVDGIIGKFGIDGYTFATRIGTTDTAINRADFKLGSVFNPFLATDQADDFDGELGADWVSYENVDSDGTAGVALNLETGAVEGSYAVGDTFSGIDHVIGSMYYDHLTGNSRANFLRGGAGVDTLIGGAGNDILEGGTGDDRLEGGAGDDTYIFNAGDGTDTIYGGGGLVFTALQGGHAESLQRLSLVDVGGNLEISIDSDGDGAFGGVYDDKVILETESSFSLYRGSFTPDNIIGRLKVGGAGSDYLFYGDDGNDILYGGDGSDYYFYGDAGNDILYGGDGSDYLFYGGEGDDILYGGDGSDYKFYGGEGDDILYGGDGSDYLFYGGEGDDILNGGADGDSLNGGLGYDTASYADATDDGDGNGVTASLAGSSLNTGEAQGDTYVSIENLIGSAFNDILTGDRNANTLSGGAGEDVLSGGRGNDKYLFNIDDGTDWITDRQGSNELYFNSGYGYPAYSSDSFTFAKSRDGDGDDLIITAIGGIYTQQVTIEDYYDISNAATFSIHYNSEQDGDYIEFTSEIPV